MLYAIHPTHDPSGAAVAALAELLQRYDATGAAIVPPLPPMIAHGGWTDELARLEAGLTSNERLVAATPLPAQAMFISRGFTTVGNAWPVEQTAGAVRVLHRLCACDVTAMRRRAALMLGRLRVVLHGEVAVVFDAVPVHSWVPLLAATAPSEVRALACKVLAFGTESYDDACCALAADVGTMQRVLELMASPLVQASACACETVFNMLRPELCIAKDVMALPGFWPALSACVPTMLSTEQDGDALRDCLARAVQEFARQSLPWSADAEAFFTALAATPRPELEVQGLTAVLTELSRDAESCGGLLLAAPTRSLVCLADHPHYAALTHVLGAVLRTGLGRMPATLPEFVSESAEVLARHVELANALAPGVRHWQSHRCLLDDPDWLRAVMLLQPCDLVHALLRYTRSPQDMQTLVDVGAVRCALEHDGDAMELPQSLWQHVAEAMGTDDLLAVAAECSTAAQERLARMLAGP